MFGNKRTCEVCGNTYSKGLEQCPRCGFTPGTAGTAAGGKTVGGVATGFPDVTPSNTPPDILTPPPTIQPTPPPTQMGGFLPEDPMGAYQAQVRTGATIAKIVVFVAVALAAAGIVFAISVGTNAVKEVTGAVRGIDFGTDPNGNDSNGNNIGGIENPTEMSPERCVTQMRKYLRRLYFDLAEQDSDDLSAGFIEASNVFGPGSDYYSRLVDIFSNSKLSTLAALGNPEKAYKRSLPLIKKACQA